MLPKHTSDNSRDGSFQLQLSKPKTPRPQVNWEAHLEGLPFAAWIGNPDGSNVFVNQAYRSLLGITKIEQVLDNGWSAFIHPADREEYEKDWAQFLESSASRFKARIRWLCPDTGHQLKLKIRAQKLDNGQIQGWVCKSTAEFALSKLEEIAHDRR
jgi:PAS domain S-box-containing protein